MQVYILFGGFVQTRQRRRGASLTDALFDKQSRSRLAIESARRLSSSRKGIRWQWVSWGFGHLRNSESERRNERLENASTISAAEALLRKSRLEPFSHPENGFSRAETASCTANRGERKHAAPELRAVNMVWTKSMVLHVSSLDACYYTHRQYLNLSVAFPHCHKQGIVNGLAQVDHCN